MDKWQIFTHIIQGYITDNGGNHMIAPIVSDITLYNMGKLSSIKPQQNKI